MRNLKDQILEELEQIYGESILEEDIEDWNDPDNLPPTEAQLKSAEELKNFLQSLILRDDLTEEFVSDRGARQHFLKHCLAKDPAKKSTRSSVYYDFKDASQYKAREKALNARVRDVVDSRTEFVGALTNTQSLQNLFHWFFEGDRCLHFSALFGIVNNEQEAALTLHSYANEATKNYPQNTVDLLILGHHNKTITMYPVDANYLESKFNNLMKKYAGWEFSLKINH